MSWRQSDNASGADAYHGLAACPNAEAEQLKLPVEPELQLSILLTTFTMLSRALRPARALPLRSRPLASLSKRLVTTDAASSHAEKEQVPEVRKTSL